MHWRGTLEHGRSSQWLLGLRASLAGFQMRVCRNYGLLKHVSVCEILYVPDLLILHLLPKDEE